MFNILSTAHPIFVEPKLFVIKRKFDKVIKNTFMYLFFVTRCLYKKKSLNHFNGYFQQYDNHQNIYYNIVGWL